MHFVEKIYIQLGIYKIVRTSIKRSIAYDNLDSVLTELLLINFIIIVCFMILTMSISDIFIDIKKEQQFVFFILFYFSTNQKYVASINTSFTRNSTSTKSRSRVPCERECPGTTHLTCMLGLVLILW